jgi:hypothetical protein
MGKVMSQAKRHVFARPRVSRLGRGAVGARATGTELLIGRAKWWSQTQRLEPRHAVSDR